MPTYPEPILTPQDAAWGRSVNSRLLALEMGDSASGTGQNATNKGLAASLDRLGATIQQLPTPEAYSSDNSNFSVTSGWSTKTSLTVNRIPGRRTVVQVTGIGHAATSNTGGGGFCWIRILLNGELASAETTMASGSNGDYSLLYFSGSAATAQDVAAGGAITVSLQMRSDYTQSIPANSNSRASLTVLAVHQA